MHKILLGLPCVVAACLTLASCEMDSYGSAPYSPTNNASTSNSDDDYAALCRKRDLYANEAWSDAGYYSDHSHGESSRSHSSGSGSSSKHCHCDKKSCCHSDDARKSCSCDGGSHRS